MRLLLFTVIAVSMNVLVNSQGESCYTHNRYAGVCIELPQCFSLIQLYRDNPSQPTIDILLANQKNCGNRKVGRNPLMCCSDGVPQATARPPPTTRPPSTTRPSPTTRQQPTPPPPTPPTALPSDNPCSDPNGIRGYCVGVKQCESILQTFIERQKDPEYIQYIRQSNANCNYASQAVCCPLQRSEPTQPSPPNEETPIAQHSGVGARLLLPSDGCGVSKVPHNRVVGGVPAKKGGWPWMALIGYKSKLGEVSFKCGGSIISKRHVLTAAHCIRNDLSSVRLGEHDLSIDTDTQHIDLPVTKVIQHPDYDKKDGHSDLAILVIGEDIPFSTLIEPICIPINEPEKSKGFVNYTPFVAGWGKTQEGGKSANVLQELQIPVISNDQCSADYEAIGKKISDKQFDDAVLCAGYREGGKDSCQGDSGGPLMFPFNVDGNYFYYQIGIVSYGIGCARSQVPGVYTAVQHFSEWIKNTVETS